MVFLQANVTEQVPKIFDAVFECTLEMINKVKKVCHCLWVKVFLLGHLLILLKHYARTYVIRGKPLLSTCTLHQQKVEDMLYILIPR